MRNAKPNLTNFQPSDCNRRTFLRTIPQAAVSLGVLSILHDIGAKDPFVLMARNYGPPTWPPFDKIQARLEEWQRQYPQLLKLEVLGTTAQGRPLFAVILTDSRVQNDMKEHVLMTAQHSGIERSGAMTMLYLVRWLLSGEPLAREVLQRQIVICMPIVNPDGYANGKHENTMGIDPHYSWTAERATEPEKAPEAVAMQKIMDRYQPEVISDIHGLDMSFREYIMYENSNASYHDEVTRLMEEEGLKEGYPLDQGNKERISDRKGREDGLSYCYHRYHTLGVANHSLWERGGFLRQRRLLQIGNEIWPGEYFPGYPTRVIMSLAHMITAYGQTASQRRRSRVELWNKRSQIMHGYNNPQTEGLVLYVCTTSPAAAEKWLTDRSLKGFQSKIKEHSGLNAEVIQRILKGHPDGPGQWGAQAGLDVYGGGGPKVSASSAIGNGLSLRLRIPYQKARMTDLRLNGHPVSPSETDGFMTWVARGFTHIQINIPPEKSRQEDLFVTTCEYDPGEKRVHGEGW